MQLLEQHFDAAFAAPDGIKKLRELILTLAMQGKLVEQDPSDQPASELLKEIEQEKRRLVAAGKIKAPKALPAIEADEVPYEMPAGWTWVHLGSIAFPQAGFAFKSNYFNQSSKGLPLIRIRDVGQPFSGTYYEGEYREEFVVNQGDHIVSMDGEFRIAQWENGKALLNQRVSRLIFYRKELENLYIIKSLQVRLSELQGTKSYTTVDHLSGGQISEALIPLPPLAEQRRIVARIDELMARCDELEALRAEREQKRLDAHTAALNALLSAQEPAAFADAWQFMTQHFSDLHSVPKNVTELRKAVLQLAVMGKLVEQDPNDPPASELLKEIEEEKNRQIVAGEIRASKPLPPVTPEETPFKVPEGWAWCRIQEISLKVTDGEHITPKREKEGYFLLSARNITNEGVKLDNVDFVGKEEFERIRKRCNPMVGDILISCSGSVGRVAISDSDDYVMVRSAAFIKHSHKRVDSLYLASTLRSPIGQSQIIAKSRTTAQSNLFLGRILEIIVPLPPLPEQRRIVAKIDQLMALCDQLETRLAAQTNTQSALLASVMATVTPGSAAPTRRAAPTRAPAGEPVRRGPGRPRKEVAEASSEDKEVTVVRRKPGRPRKNPTEPTRSIPEATSTTDAIRRLEALKIERATGTRQVGLFECEADGS